VDKAEERQGLTPCVVNFERPIVCYKQEIMILRYRLEDGKGGSVCIRFSALCKLVRSAGSIFRRIVPQPKPRRRWPGWRI
jgi:hypothetical protein